MLLPPASQAAPVLPRRAYIPASGAQRIYTQAAGNGVSYTTGLLRESVHPNIIAHFVTFVTLSWGRILKIFRYSAALYEHRIIHRQIDNLSCCLNLPLI